METEVVTRRSGIKVVFIILLLLICAFAIFFSVMSVMSPARKLAIVKNEILAKHSDQNSIDNQVLNDSSYRKYYKEKLFLQSRIVMAESDSIYLILNLSDSSANLEISGVVVHAAKISEIKVSKILLKGEGNVIFSKLASPFTISGSVGTIRRDPILVKMAPKDTSEYIPDVNPDTSLTEPVNYILETTDGTRIFVYQEENEKKSDRISQFKFDTKDKVQNTINSLKSVVAFKVPDYHLYIKIKLPRADAKIIYRALPKNGQVAVFW
jgi:hypothetical protein